MERTLNFVRTCSLLLSLLAIVSSSQRFEFPSSPTRSPGLHVVGTGKVYTAAGSRLYRLNSSLQLEETRILTSEAVNISLSNDGRWLVVCLTDLSCEVYNATNFSAGQVFMRESAITSTENIALFAVEESFYVGSITTTQGVGGAQQSLIVLGQHRFNENQQQGSSTNSYVISRPGFVRNLYGSGFVQRNNTYYFAVDNDPSSLRSLKVMRICHNSNFNALYELTLACGSRTPVSVTRISGVSVIEEFPGISGPTVVLSINRPLPSTTNLVCLYSLEAIDNRMQEKLNSCDVNVNTQIALSWRNDEPLCSGFSVSYQHRCYSLIIILFTS